MSQICTEDQFILVLCKSRGQRLWAMKERNTEKYCTKYISTH